MRKAKVQRNTKETKISATVNLDGTGRSKIETGIGFLDHMLEQISRHGLIDLDLKAKGDLHIDDHHTTEDSGYVLGDAIAKALGEMDTELFKEWFQAFSQALGANIHVENLYGTNNHHIIESCYKGLARSLRDAVQLVPRISGKVPSTKGVLRKDG